MITMTTSSSTSVNPRPFRRMDADVVFMVVTWGVTEFSALHIRWNAMNYSVLIWLNHKHRMVVKTRKFKVS
jgi:hypothetical protein